VTAINRYQKFSIATRQCVFTLQPRI